MAIRREDGFFVDPDPAEGVSIGIESTRLDSCIKEVLKRAAVGVFGAPHFGFTGSNLDFLGRLRHLERVWFWDVDLQDVDGLYELERLSRFGVHPKRPPIDFGRLDRLEEVVWHYSAKDSGLASLASMRMLHLWHYNPKQRTFDDLRLPGSLTELQINWANPTTLEGLPLLPNVKRLEIHRCRNLESIEELPRIAPNVEHLVVAACGRVSDGAEVVRHLPRLRHAYVRDQVLVSA